MSFDLNTIRRQLHQTPELAFQEQQTKALLLNWLQQLDGIQIHEFKSCPGLLVEYSSGSGAYRLFRADMDALPVKENTGCDFTSRTEGMMHACGHDVHMTILLGLIDRMVQLKPDRNLLFLFQPAEEGQGGAETVLAEGLIQNYPVEAVFALHAAGGLPVGTISCREGVIFGVPQEFDVTFNGKPAHAAFPEQGINALLSGVEFMNRMQADISELSSQQRVIFHVGKMASGTIRNVIPGHCKLEGTQRSLSKPLRDIINELIRKNATLATAQTGAEARVDFLCSYDPVVNAPELVKTLQQVCTDLEIVYQEAESTLAGEDFGYFTSLYPGLLFWLGSGCNEPLHSDRFLPLSDCIATGVKIFEQLALR